MPNAFVRHQGGKDGGDEDGQFCGNCAILDEIPNPPSLVPSRPVFHESVSWKLESSVKSRYQKNRGKEGH